MSSFALHQIYTPSSASSKVDIVFVHGLGGDFNETWETNSNDQSQNCWPLWLAKKFPGASISFLQYPTSKLSSMFGGTDMSLLTAAAGVADLLRADKLGIRPLIFVTHSLGGIIAKAVLRICESSSEKSLEALFSNCKGVVFFGTPHTGSTYSTVFNKVPSLPSLQAQGLAQSNAVLMEIYNWYRNTTQDGSIRSKAFYETLPMGPEVVVDAGSANPGVPRCDPSPIEANHVNMCKFGDEFHPAYKSVVTFLEEVFSDGKIDTGDSSSIDDLEYYLSNVVDDRKTLEQKLHEGGRQAELRYAEREKERIAKTIQREALSPSARKEYRNFLGEVLTRFRLHVGPLIRSGESQTIVNKAIDEHVITPLTSNGANHQLGNYADIHSAIYYLTGNCHLDWLKHDV
ncbi:ABC-three component system protein [Maritalea sp.]|uniref:ABC-three component system protein n=1 Tax=Maritalea sp. TaxID=2003361 RepID=UPI0039E2E5EB